MRWALFVGLLMVAVKCESRPREVVGYPYVSPGLVFVAEQGEAPTGPVTCTSRNATREHMDHRDMVIYLDCPDGVVLRLVGLDFTGPVTMRLAGGK